MPPRVDWHGKLELLACYFLNARREEAPLAENELSKHMVLSRTSLQVFVTMALLVGCATKQRDYHEVSGGGAGGDAGETATEPEGGNGGETTTASGGTGGKRHTVVQGGTKASGGKSATGGVSTTGGTSEVAGGSAMGGSTASGGTTEIGGTSATGGSSATGGTSSTMPPLECSGNVSTGWKGCRGTGCLVCSELVSSYPLYFAHHKNCTAAANCENDYYTCSDNCPEPTPIDINGGPECSGVYSGSGTWSGCLSSGCLVCQDRLTDYPNYIKNHPDCGINPVCNGSALACSSLCPAPTDADK
jgi:hypothetical protein